MVLDKAHLLSSTGNLGTYSFTPRRADVILELHVEVSAARSAHLEFPSKRVKDGPFSEAMSGWSKASPMGMTGPS